MSKIGSISVAALTLLFFACKPALGQTKTIVPKNINKEVSVRGTFSARGKLGPFLKLKECTEPVYLLSNPQSKSQVKLWFPEGASLSATGILRYQAGAKPASGNEQIAGAQPYYYFEIESVKLRQR